MSIPLAYGIDYGTTNSSISIAYPDRVEVLELNPGAPLPAALPSIVYLHRNQLRLSGAEAVRAFTITGNQFSRCADCSLVADCRQYQRGSGCLDSRLMGELKNELANEQFNRTHSWAVDFSMEDLTAVVFDDLRRRADRHTGRETTRVVVGYPVAFFGTAGEKFPELQDLAEARLREAAYRAGFEEVELYPEPAAVALDERLEDGYAVAVDFGGGTFDVAVIQIEGGEGEVVSMQGAAVGGSILDRLIFEQKVAPELGLESRSIPAWFKKGLAGMGEFKYLLTNPQTFIVLGQLESLSHRVGSLIRSIVSGGQAYRFYKAIEDAKIRLSETDVSSIEFHPPQASMSIPLFRSELNRMAAPSVDTAKSQIRRALEDAKIGPAQVSTVFRTGGSSRLGAFVDMLEGLFGSEKVQEREAFTTVAHGLGVLAQETWL